ncbi:MAG: aspartate aminotransferase family protein [Flavobacteriales bacterium]|nr:aspartate aminotransferase family protein [Flavobacteriales bacterium]
MNWEKLTHDQINERVKQALSENMSYKTKKILGVPASYLDEEQFYDDAPFLEESPFLATLIANPNHIGCHTLSDESEPFFKGTQQLEKELISICAEEIFAGDQGQQDGYVAPGGTEANIQALWIYRNYFMREHGAGLNEIALVYSQDSHYSMPKGGNLLHLKSIVLEVDEHSRAIKPDAFEHQLQEARAAGIRYFIVVMNLSTTMFGSVDDIDLVTAILYKNDINFKLHVDGAFGGFIYPFTCPESSYTFRNPAISSFTLDGHKMLQSPYGTGIFLTRKGLMQYALTEEAAYVKGKDYTICGSRSGANAISIWMILRTHGSDGLKVRMQHLADKAGNLCDRLGKAGVEFFRNPYINIITIKAEYITKEIAAKYSLVPDQHDHPSWYKIVMMHHVKQGVLDNFMIDLKATLHTNAN